MKQVFYKGLLALTIAFGFTSCDKNDVGEVNGPLTSVTKGITSKVSFGESTGIKVEGKGNVAGKTASEFTHIYSSEPQLIAIYDSSNDVVFMGSYEAGNIVDGIDPLDGYAVPIILQNGSYTVRTENGGDEGVGYLPYSSSASFDLDSTTETIQLIPAYTHGFVIVNVEAATENTRVTGVIYNIDGVANGYLEGPDADLDYYGYLPANTYGIHVGYDLNGSDTVIDGTQRVVAGLAHTINLTLTPDTPETSETTLVPEASTEILANLDVNLDNDKFDIISRVNSSTITTTGGVAGEAVIEEGVWGVTSDIDVSVTTATVTNTEALINNPRSLNSDDDLYDVLRRVETTTVTSTDSVVTASDTANGAWTVIEDRSSPGFGETPGTSNFVARAYSVWSPLTAAVDVENIDQSRTVLNADASASFDPAIAEVLTQTVSNSAYVADEADEYLSSSSITSSVGGVETTMDAGDAVVTFLYGGSSYTSLELAQDAADADSAAAGTTVTIVSSSSQGRSIETTALVVTTTTVYTVQINVREDASPLPAKDDLVVPVTTPASSVAGVAVVSTSDLSHAVAAADLPAEWIATPDGATDSLGLSTALYSNADQTVTFFVEDDFVSGWIAVLSDGRNVQGLATEALTVQAAKDLIEG